MAVKVVIIVAVALTAHLALSDFSGSRLSLKFGDLTDFVESLKNGTYSSYSPNVTATCIRKHREDFKCLAHSLADLTTKVSDRLENLLKNATVTAAMKNLAGSFRQLSKKFWPQLEVGDYPRASISLDSAARTEYETIRKVLKGLGSNSTTNQRVKAQFKKIYDSEKNKTEKLTKSIKDCFEAQN